MLWKDIWTPRTLVSQVALSQILQVQWQTKREHELSILLQQQKLMMLKHVILLSEMSAVFILSR